ncbi:MAG: SGNH/GDSL hydrolase family protein [Anaerolineae bacterium]|nr:SGNH/GDSL hydrolase family protein [Anaerolineae bacterium]
MRRLNLVVTLAVILCGIALGVSAAVPSVAADPTPTPIAFTPLPEPTEAPVDEAALAQIDLRALPILPDFSANADFLRSIYAEGKRRALNANAFSKVGDCMTASPNFLVPFGTGKYTLGEYASLQAVIVRFSAPIRENFNSFTNLSLAAASGFNAASVLDATWSDPKLCEFDESPLACEYRYSQPAFAVIMFGTNDLKSLTPSQFDYYLRRVLVETVNRGIIPLVSTFPNQPGFTEQSIFYNRIVARAAADYNLPLVNVWRAFEPLPFQGIDPKEPTHMTKPENGDVASFAPEALQAGHNLHNLLTLQALEALLALLE